MNEYVGNYKVSDLEVAIRTLETFRYDMLDGFFDGWGLDDNYVLCVKHWLENLKDGVFAAN